MFDVLMTNVESGGTEWRVVSRWWSLQNAADNIFTTPGPQGGAATDQQLRLYRPPVLYCCCRLDKLVVTSALGHAI